MTEAEKFLDYFEIVNASGEAEVEELEGVLDGFIKVTIRDNDNHICLSKIFDPKEADSVKFGGDVLADLSYKNMRKEFDQYNHKFYCY